MQISRRCKLVERASS